MRKIFKRIKHEFQAISFPSRKELILDTVFVMISAAAASVILGIINAGVSEGVTLIFSHL